MPVITIVVIGVAEHTVCEAGVATAVGVGFTNTVAVIGVPGQPLAVGVMVNVTVTGAVVVLVSVPLMFPAPLAAIPVAATVLSLVQLYTTPATALPVMAMVVIAMPEHTVCEAGVATAVGVGFTNTVAVKVAGPAQPLASSGVMVNVTVTGDVVVLVNVPLILPVPLAAIPVAATVLFLVQLYDAAPPESTMVVIGIAEHTVCEAGVAISPVPTAVNSSAPISGGLFLTWQSISSVTLTVTPLLFKHQFTPAAALKCRSVAEINVGNTFCAAPSFAVAACKAATVVWFTGADKLPVAPIKKVAPAAT